MGLIFWVHNSCEQLIKMSIIGEDNPTFSCWNGKRKNKTPRWSKYKRWNPIIYFGLCLTFSWIPFRTCVTLNLLEIWLGSFLWLRSIEKCLSFHREAFFVPIAISFSSIYYKLPGKCVRYNILKSYCQYLLFMLWGNCKNLNFTTRYWGWIFLWSATSHLEFIDWLSTPGRPLSHQSLVPLVITLFQFVLQNFIERRSSSYTAPFHQPTNNWKLTHYAPFMTRRRRMAPALMCSS